MTYIIRQGAYETLYDMPLLVNWPLTWMCNYKCSYCFGQEALDKNKFVPFEYLVNAINNLYNLNRPFYEFGIIGGEPTAYPDFLELINIISSKFQSRISKILITSNGSRNLDFFKRLSYIAESTPIYLYISIHTEFASIAHLCSLIKELSSKINLNFRLMLNPAKWNFIEDLYREFCMLRKNYWFGMSFELILSPPNFTQPMSSYKPWQMQRRDEMELQFMQISREAQLSAPIIHLLEFNTFFELTENGKLLHKRGGSRIQNYLAGLFDFKDMYCCCGTHNIRIDPDGSMKGAVCLHDGYYDNIYKRDLFKNSDFMHIVKCPAEKCSCDANDFNLKFRDEQEAVRFVESCKSRQLRLLKPNNSVPPGRSLCPKG